MALKCYRKLFPATKVVIGTEAAGNQSLVEFSTLDSVVGFYATEQEFVQNEFARLTREQRYGILEIQFPEFERDYLEKKNRQSVPPKSWREELSRSTSKQGSDPVVHLGSGSLGAALRVNGSGDVRQNNKSGVIDSGLAMETSAPAGSGPRALPVTIADASTAPGPEPAQKFVPTIGKRKATNSKK